MRLARLLSKRPKTEVYSIFRNPEHTKEIAETGAKPLVLSLEDDTEEKFAEIFEDKDVVYFSAGAGGKGGPERTRKVDYEGALKVYNAIELVRGTKPRLILVSAVDVRDPNIIPAHYVCPYMISWTHNRRSYLIFLQFSQIPIYRMMLIRQLPKE